MKIFRKIVISAILISCIIFGESNIENIKIKINRTRTKPVAKGSALYRFLAFLFALVGF